MIYFHPKQKGVAAVEFGLIFLPLFLLLYGLLTYSLIFAVQHSLVLAASEGGRAAVRFVSAADTVEVRKNSACFEIMKSLGWLKGVVGDFSCTESGGGGSGVEIKLNDGFCAQAVGDSKCLETLINYDYKNNPIIPSIGLFPVPEKLSGKSFIRFSLSY